MVNINDMITEMEGLKKSQKGNRNPNKNQIYY